MSLLNSDWYTKISAKPSVRITVDFGRTNWLANGLT